MNPFFSADRDQKRASAPAGQAAEVPEVRPEKVESPVKMDITKDLDSDFAELNPLDDIDVSDQLVYKTTVRSLTLMCQINLFIKLR